MFNRNSSTHSYLVMFVLLVSAVLVFSCSQQPTAIEGEPGGGGLSGKGEIDPGAGGSFLLGAVSDSAFAAGYIDVWAMDVAYDSVSGIVSFDVELVNNTEHEIPAPIHFVITEIIPWNIAVMEFDGTTGDGFPYYDFSDKLGGDGVLEQGERSGRVTMKFHTARPRSFAIGFRIDLGPPPGGGLIAGVVYRDDNRNGKRDICSRPCEPGIQGITVALEKPLSGGDRALLLTRTDANGGYRFGGLDAGAYKVFVEPRPDMWIITSANPLLVTLVEGPGGVVQDFREANFGLFPIGPPASDILFGPVTVGPFSPYGEVLDSVFVDTPSVLPVVYTYYLDVSDLPYEGIYPAIIDSAAAWINGVQVFDYVRVEPPDTAYFPPQTVRLPDSLVQIGENTIRLTTYGTERAGTMWRVYKKP